MRRVVSVDLDGSNMLVVIANNGVAGIIRPLNFDIYGDDDDIVFLDRDRDEIIVWKRRDNSAYAIGKGTFIALFDIYITKCKYH